MKYIIKMFRVTTVVFVLFCLAVQLFADDSIDTEIENLKTLQKQNELNAALNILSETYQNQCNDISAPQLRLEDFTESTDAPETYDYVILGGGTAGSVIANRLTEESGFRVLVLEQGQEEASPITSVPVLNPYCYCQNFTDKKPMEPQDEIGQGMQGGRLVACNGMGMGGSSLTSDMTVSRSHKSFFKSWGEQWCSDDLLQYFQKFERTEPSANKQSAYHRFDGVLSHSDSHISDLGDAFLNCGIESGYSVIDPSGDFDEGIFRVKALTNNGRRQNHAEAFLKQCKSRPNLITKTGSISIKILIDANKNAYGVRYINKNDMKIYTVFARKEVIVCLGTFDSAKILLLSGIGPKEDLNNLGIPVMKDLGVGKQMYDQIAYIGLIWKSNCAYCKLNDIINDQTKAQFVNDGSGPLSSANSIESIVYKKINSPTPNLAIQLVSRTWNLDNGTVLRKTVNMDEQFYRTMYQELEGSCTFSVVPVLTAKSSGRLTLRSTDPFDKPILYGNYYKDSSDRKNMIDAIKYILSLMQCNSFNNCNITYFDKKIPACANKNGDEYWKCAISYLTASYQAHIGTCAIGKVVDDDLQVIGVNNLRVSDSSVMPSALGPTHVVTTMLAEKTADSIKAKAGVRVKKFCQKPDSASSSMETTSAMKSTSSSKA